MIGAIIAKKKARSGFDSLSRHDLDKFLADWADDAMFICPGNLSVSGEINGKEAIREWFMKYIDQFPISSFNLKNVFVENIFALGGTNTIAVEWDVKLNNRDGEEFDNSGVTIISLKGGKAVLVRDYISDLEVTRKAWGAA